MMAFGAGRRCLAIVLNTFTNDMRVLKECRTLHDAGFTVTLFALHAPGLPRHEQTDFGEVYRFALRTKQWSKRRPVQLIKYVEAMERMVHAGRKLSPQIVHANDLNALPIGYRIAQASHSPLVYDSHELWRGAAHQALFPAWMYQRGVQLEAMLAKRASVVLTVSESIADDMAQHLGIPRPFVVRNLPYHHPRESLLAQSHPLHRDFGIAEEKPIVLYQGGLGKGRGAELLLTAFSQVPQPAVLAFLGGDGQHERLRAEIEKRGLSGRVYLHPSVPPDQLLSYTADAILGVCPIEGIYLSYAFSLPNKLFEYIQAGIPVVATDLPEMGKLVRQWGVGEVFADRDPRSLAQAITLLLQDQQRWERCRQAAARAAETLCWEKEQERLLEAYRVALGEKGISA